MRNRGQLILGALLIGLGVLFLLGTLLDINIWAIVWSAGLIALGVVLLLRPRMARAGTRVDITLIGDTRHTGIWQAGPEEVWSGIGDVHMDYSQASLPEVETTLRVFSLIGDVNLILPAGVGLSVVASGIFCELKHWGEKQEGFLSPLTYTNPEYATASRRVRVETVGLITEVSIRQ